MPFKKNSCKAGRKNPLRVSSDHIKTSVFPPEPELHLPERRENISEKTVGDIQEELKARIGQELHDSVGPLLTVAKLYLEFLPAASQEEKFAKRRICSSILAAIQNIREISSELVISTKNNCDLKGLIKRLIRDFNKTNLFCVEFEYTQQKKLAKLSHDCKLALYRIIQEQLNNTVKYSKAKQITIKLYSHEQEVHLLLSDNGTGFDISKPIKGIGLLNIHERVGRLNGRMTLKSSPGQGCSLLVSIPVIQHSR